MLTLLSALVALGVFFLFRISHFLFCIAVVLQEQRDRRKMKEIERLNRREQAEQALKDAIRDLRDRKFKEVDYALGIGHGYRRAERIVDAKRWGEIEKIISGEDIPTELDKLHFWEATEERGREGK